MKTRRQTIQIMTTLAGLGLALALAVPALAAYIGPDRTVTTSYNYWWIRDTCYDSNPDTWCGVAVVWHPPPSDIPSTGACVPGYSASNGFTCTQYEFAYSHQYPAGVYRIDQLVGSGTTTHPPATVSSSLQCSQPGSDGWCRGSASLSLTGSEPLAGYSILAIEGARNGVAFAFPGASAPVPLLEGQNDFTFWALSSWGDSSLMGSASGKVDTQPPGISGSLSGLSGDNGWYVSTVELSASASDPTPGSGLDIFEYALDGGPWTPYATAVSIFTGIHDIDLRAIDQAGNESTATQAIQVDAVPPQASLEADGSFCPGCGQTLSVTFSLSDATSGIASWELTAGGTILTGGTGQAAQTYPWNGSGLGAGTHTLILSVTDRAGNTSERSVSVQLIAPTPLPGASPVPAAQPTAPASTPIPGSSSSSLPGGTQETHEPSSSNTGQDGAGSSAAPSRTPVVSIFSSAKPTLVPDAGGGTDPDLTGDTDQPPIAWGAVAMAAMGGLTAYVLDEQRKRKQAEAQQKAEVELRAARFNAEQEQRRAEAMEEQRKKVEAAAYWAKRSDLGEEKAQEAHNGAKGNLWRDNIIGLDDGECGTPMTIDERLWRYGVKLENSFSNKDQISILLGVQAVADKLAGTMRNSNESDAFKKVFDTYTEPLVFSWKDPADKDAFTKGGWTQNSHLIWFSGKQWTTSDKLSVSDQLFYMRNNVVHELGHAFAARFPWNIGSTENPQANPDHPYNMVPDDLLSEVGWPDPYEAWRQHPSTMDNGVFSPGEVFADMFIGWVFDTYAEDLAGVGDSRREFMTIYMPTWFIP